MSNFSKQHFEVMKEIYEYLKLLEQVEELQGENKRLTTAYDFFEQQIRRLREENLLLKVKLDKAEKQLKAGFEVITYG